MIIESFEPFVGQHCETTATGSLIKHAGLDLSEPMLFGIGQGLGFVYWDMKAMDFPFLGGRIKQNLITDNLAVNLGLELHRDETSSIKRAWDTVRSSIDAGQPVGLQLDSYYLDYFTTKVHFGGHFVAMYGYDASHAYIVDTDQQGTRAKAELDNLQLARNARGPMTSRNLSYTIALDDLRTDLASVALRAIAANAADFLNPPIQNLGFKGIARAAREVNRWLTRTDTPEQDLTLAAVLMERAGTGGALFRNFYRDFLGECMALFDSAELESAHRIYAEVAPLWTQVSTHIHDAGTTRDQHHLDLASALLASIAEKERTAMQALAAVDSNPRLVPVEASR
jgi:hypothetical protein